MHMITTLMAESKEELNSLLMKWESEKAGLKLSIIKTDWERGQEGASKVLINSFFLQLVVSWTFALW